MKKRNPAENKYRFKEQNKILEKIFTNTNFLIAYLDKDFNFIRVNKAYALADGRDVNFFTGKNHFELYPHQENQAIFKRVVETGEPYLTHAKPFVYPENPERGVTYWDWSLQPIKNKRGTVESLILILLDVTEREKMEENLIKTTLALSETKRLSDIGTLAATVAHELRNPLAVIQTAAYNIRRKNKDAQLVKHIDHIEKKIAESERIINNLLNYSRIKKPQKKRIHLLNFINECIATVKTQYHSLNIVLKKDLKLFKDLIIYIDPFQIREVLANILNNAFQALQDKSGWIEIKGSLTPAREILIEVNDNGEGIDKQDLDAIFDPFFTRKSKGTGLGLTICRELVNLHEGRININSHKNKGTQVLIYLPLRMTDEK
jgi:PAS domain S-box-containing protein